MMDSLLAVDPGIRTLGYAFFHGGVLTKVGLSRAGRELTLDECVWHHRATLLEVGSGVSKVVCERMVHRVGHFGVPPQDLMDVNIVAGAVGKSWLTPSQWKFNVPKEIHQPRILACLSEAERALVDSVKPASLRHNAIDAVGIGLYSLGRLKCPTSSPSTRPSFRSSRTAGGSSTRRSKSSRAKRKSSKTTGRGS